MATKTKSNKPLIIESHKNNHLEIHSPDEEYDRIAIIIHVKHEYRSKPNRLTGKQEAKTKTVRTHFFLSREQANDLADYLTLILS